MATFTWNGATGDWTAASVWTPSSGPTGTDDALINAAGTYTVTVGTADNVSINNLTLDAGTATLEVDGTLTANGTITVNAGTLDSLTSLGADTFAINDGGTLLNVTEPAVNVIDDGGVYAYDATGTLDESPLTLENGGVLQALDTTLSPATR